MLLQNGNAGCGLVACGHFSPLQFSPNLRFNLLSTPETHKVMEKKIYFHQDTMSCLFVMEAVVQWKAQENDKTEPPLSLSGMHRLSDNQKMTEIPTPQHYSLVLYMNMQF